MSDKTLYTIIVHSENIAGLLNQVTAAIIKADSFLVHWQNK